MTIWSIGIGPRYPRSATVSLQFSSKVPKWVFTQNTIFLRWHTETGNIWTHLVGGLIFIGLTLYYLLLPNMRFTGNGFGMTFVKVD